MNQEVNQKKLRILHAPRNVANQATIATEALRERGHFAESWDIGTNPFGFKADKTLAQDMPFDTRWQLLNKAIQKFDIFHFHFGNTLFPSYPQMLPFWDLPILKAMGKKVFMHFHGTDIRMQSIHKQNNPWAEEFYRDQVTINEKWLQDRLLLFSNFCDAIFVSSYELLDYAPMAQVIPRALDVRAWEFKPAPQNRPLKIIHAPSNHNTKGTHFILRGIEELKKRNNVFEFQLIQNVPHSELKREIENADILIDQLLIGDCGLASFEAMVAGTIPVAYIMPRIEEQLSNLSVYNVNPSNFVERMETLIKNTELMRKLARTGREYAIANHSKQHLGTVLENCYTNTKFKPFNKGQVEWVARNTDEKAIALNKRITLLESTLEPYKKFSSSSVFKFYKKSQQLFNTINRTK